MRSVLVVMVGLSALLQVAICQFAVGEAYVPDPEELRQWQEERNVERADQLSQPLANGLSAEDAALLKWAKSLKAKEARREQLGNRAYAREALWLAQGQKQFDTFHKQLAVSRGSLVLPRKWSELDQADQLVWAHLAKVNQADLVGWNDSGFKLYGRVEDNHFIISGRYREVQQFATSVHYLQSAGLTHGDYSNTLYLKVLSDDLQKQSEQQAHKGSGDNKKTLRVRWEICGEYPSKSLWCDEKTIDAINEVIEIWPGELVIGESDWIKSTKPYKK